MYKEVTGDARQAIAPSKEKEYRILLERIETTSGKAIFRYGAKITEESAMVYLFQIKEKP